MDIQILNNNVNVNRDEKEGGRRHFDGELGKEVAPRLRAPYFSSTSLHLHLHLLPSSPALAPSLAWTLFLLPHPPYLDALPY